MMHGQKYIEKLLLCFSIKSRASFHQVFWL